MKMMNKPISLGVFAVFLLLLQSTLYEIALARGSDHATTPPRGWNSYDSFSWVVTEQQFLQNAQLVSKRLHSHGYQFVVVDYLWYRRNVPNASADSYGFDSIDEWGRMVPDSARWPCSEGGKGFANVAEEVHDMGLKFGIHVMRGISTQAFNSNTPILDTTAGAAYREGGRVWRARDIGIKERTCAWMSNGFMSVDTKLGAGRAFLRSLYQQYAEWGVDFVKHDCVFGDDLDIEEITAVSEILRKLERPILYSISPGTSVTPEMAKQVKGLVNMYRITGDDWDKWGDVAAHFDVARDLASSSMIGSRGLKGKSWPDLDMLPLGWLTDPGANHGPYRHCNLTYNEQKTQMTLWAMMKSPLMFGGDLRRIDKTTYNLITNPVALEINSFSSNNKEFPYISSTLHPKKAGINKFISALISLTVKSVKDDVVGSGGVHSWAASGRRGEVYVAFFNLNQETTLISAKLSDLEKVLPGRKLSADSCKCREVWSGHEHFITGGSISMDVQPHGTSLFVLNY